MTTVRPFLVLDVDGMVVGEFSGWEAAHQWAHERAVERTTSGTVRVEDPARRRTLTATSAGCVLTTWKVAADETVCPGSGGGV